MTRSIEDLLALARDLRRALKGIYDSPCHFVLMGWLASIEAKPECPNPDALVRCMVHDVTQYESNDDGEVLLAYLRGFLESRGWPS